MTVRNRPSRDLHLGEPVAGCCRREGRRGAGVTPGPGFDRAIVPFLPLPTSRGTTTRRSFVNRSRGLADVRPRDLPDCVSGRAA